MATILEYIGQTISTLNPTFQDGTVNGIQLPGGEVVRFTDQKEKQFIGPGDNFDKAFYIRITPQITFNQTERRLTSSQPSLAAVKQCRLVAYSWDSDDTSEGLMNKLISDLKSIEFTDFEANRRPVITVRRANPNYIDNLTGEYKKEIKDIQKEFVCVSIDFDLKNYYEDCSYEIDMDALYVSIFKNGQLVAQKRPPQEYSYTTIEFSGIVDNGPPYTNSIVDA